MLWILFWSSNIWASLPTCEYVKDTTFYIFNAVLSNKYDQAMWDCMKLMSQDIIKEFSDSHML